MIAEHIPTMSRFFAKKDARERKKDHITMDSMNSRSTGTCRRFPPIKPHNQPRPHEIRREIPSNKAKLIAVRIA